MSDPYTELWFYVPDYTLIAEALQEAYRKTGVEEHSAEPGRVGGSQTDADIHVRGTDAAVARLWNWLRDSQISGLMLEGRHVHT